MSVYFPKSNSTWIPGFMGNRRSVNEFVSEIREIEKDSSFVILDVRYFSEASPEGKVQLNEQISLNRGKSITALLHRYLPFSDSVVHLINLNEDWSYLLERIKESSIPFKDEVIAVFNSTLPDDSREQALKSLRNGVPWSYMYSKFFPKMRRVRVVITVGIPEPSVGSMAVYDGVVEDLFVPVEDEPLVFEFEPLQVDTLHVRRGPFKDVYLKSNVAGLGLLVANAAVEVDLGKGFSFALPVYYSAWNYFTSSVKFRTLAFQPELRYWFNRKYRGVYAGAHFGLGWYNVATGGGWRIQDKDGKTPAVGGGLSAGYRMPLGKGWPRWQLEFAVGGGIYSVEYDKFHNWFNGTLYGKKKKTYIGLDQAAVNLVYKFPHKGSFNGKRRSGK